MTGPSELDQDTVCLTGVYLSEVDRNIYWFGGTITMLATAFILLGYYKFKELRKPPGDLILGMAFSDFLLSFQWIILSTWYQQVDDSSFCTFTGIIGVFSGANEFLYDVSFSLYLIISLRNALKQTKVPQRVFHTINVGCSLLFTIYLLSNDEIGKTPSGTCAIKTDCSEEHHVDVGMIISIIYACLGAYTYYYVKKNLPKCKKADNKRAQFLVYYLRYIVASILIYLLVSIMSLAMNVLIQPQDLERQYLWINHIFNIVKLCSPIVLSFIRYNDPVIKKFMLKTIFFWRGDIQNRISKLPLTEPPMTNNTLEMKLLSNRPEPSVIVEKNPSVNSSNRGSDIDEFVVNKLALERKEELTYTLLTSAMYINQLGYLKSTGWIRTISAKGINSPQQHSIRSLGDDPSFLSFLRSLPDIQKELERRKFQILPGTLKIYYPEIFESFMALERDYLDLNETLDFQKNRKEIKSVSSGEGGKSGEFFFFSTDKKLILKTISDSELKILLSMMQDYQKHFEKYPNSLIAKILGVFTYENEEEHAKFNIIMMKNICGFPGKFVTRRYDLKGSRYDRQVLLDPKPTGRTSLQTSVLKDLDFEKYEKKLNIRGELKFDFLEQIEADANFFKSHNLIDYSFMVFCVDKGRFQREVGIVDDFTSRNPLASLENIEEEGVFYNVGIIDYLQPYTFGKALEKVAKRVRAFDSKLETSSQDPLYYSERFIKFIKKITYDVNSSFVSIT